MGHFFRKGRFGLYAFVNCPFLFSGKLLFEEAADKLVVAIVVLAGHKLEL